MVRGGKLELGDFQRRWTRGRGDGASDGVSGVVGREGGCCGGWCGRIWNWLESGITGREGEEVGWNRRWTKGRCDIRAGYGGWWTAVAMEGGLVT